jgi:hypothetical protein
MDIQPEYILYTELKMMSQLVEVGLVDQEAQRNLQLLYLQAITRLATVWSGPDCGLF